MRVLPLLPNMHNTEFIYLIATGWQLWYNNYIIGSLVAAAAKEPRMDVRYFRIIIYSSDVHASAAYHHK